MIEQPALFHTLPLSYLKVIKPCKGLYIESEYCMQNPEYAKYFQGTFCENIVLDCGVGLDASVAHLQSFVLGDRDWAVKYYDLIDRLSPDLAVAPDVLGNGLVTRRNFELYTELSPVKTPWMYVIQGKTIAEAEAEITWALSAPNVYVVGFPRVVHYYGSNYSSSEELGQIRIKLISKYLSLFKEAAIAVHVLGLNSYDELRFVAKHGLSCDSRLASLLATAGLKVDGKRPLNRPQGLKVDMLHDCSVETLELIDENVYALQCIFRDGICQ